jgi:uncharacterized protein
MTEATTSLDVQEQHLLALVASYGSVAVAYSGGVDSAVVAAAAQRALGDRAVAVTAVSPSLASGEWELAAETAARIGIRHVRLFTHEFERPGYVRNAFNRCYFCKTELYNRLRDWATQEGFSVLANGTNSDDQGDHRPGLQAAAEAAVQSPLIDAGFHKADVRALAQRWQLPVWDKPASPCLASRIAYGIEVTPARVARIDAAESWLRARLELRELRVRLEAHELARIEVPVDELSRLLEADCREALVREFHRLGFRAVTVDLEGFRSGSLNALLPPDVLTAPRTNASRS